MRDTHRYRVVVADVKTWPSPNWLVFRTNRLRLRRLARGVKT